MDHTQTHADTDRQTHTAHTDRQTHMSFVRRMDMTQSDGGECFSWTTHRHTHRQTQTHASLAFIFQVKRLIFFMFLLFLCTSLSPANIVKALFVPWHYKVCYSLYSFPDKKYVLKLVKIQSDVCEPVGGWSGFELSG